MDSTGYTENINYGIKKFLLELVPLAVLMILISAFLDFSYSLIGFVAIVWIGSIIIRLRQKVTVTVDQEAIALSVNNDIQKYPLLDVIDFAPCFFMRDRAVPFRSSGEKARPGFKQTKLEKIYPCMGGVMLQMSSGKIVVIPTRKSARLLDILRTRKPA